MEAFVDEFAPTGASGILDVGGTETNWRFVDVPSRIVLLNLTVPEPGDARPSNIEWVAGNGCDLHYDDDEFDICFSNSTIEHLHTYENQKRFAAEVRRVAPSYYVQTPGEVVPLRAALARVLRPLAPTAVATAGRALGGRSTALRSSRPPQRSTRSSTNTGCCPTAR